MSETDWSWMNGSSNPMDFEGFAIGLQISDYFKSKQRIFEKLSGTTWYDIERRLMRSAARYTVKRIKQQYSSYFANPPKDHPDKFTNPKFKWGKKEPKNLYESIRYRLWKRDLVTMKFGATIFAHVHSPFNGVFYGMALEEGYSYTTKGGKVVNVPPKHFLYEPGFRAVREPGIVQAMDKTLDRIMKEMEKSGYYKFEELSED